MDWYKGARRKSEYIRQEITIKLNNKSTVRLKLFQRKMEKA